MLWQKIMGDIITVQDVCREWVQVACLHTAQRTDMPCNCSSTMKSQAGFALCALRMASV